MFIKMWDKMLNRLFSSPEKILSKYHKYVVQIDELEAQVAALSESEIKAKTVELKTRLSMEGSLEKILPEAFALVREAASRTMNMRHYKVQLLGGMVLNDGCIAEMKTGEGKTLVATLPSYLNALTGRGVHIVTVNEYLAKRDYEWMARIHRYLGLETGLALSAMGIDDKKKAYQADITYVTNSEIGFDYLRDNTRFKEDDMVLAGRPFNYAIIDEVDSILIDEARTPLIISGEGKKNLDIYPKINKVIAKMQAEHYEIDEKHRTVQFTDLGNDFLEKELRKANLLAANESIYELEKYEILNNALQSLKAHKLFMKDKDYITANGEVLLIDEFTGRVMEGRRYSEGLHQAIEAKEGARIQSENQTIASITYQNLFRLYPKLAGMTGTAQTEADEFQDIYRLKVIPIPTHRLIIRDDKDDLVFKTEKVKFDHIAEKVEECYKKGQPILVGTTSIAKSEELSAILKKKSIPHNVLNAKSHEKEAKIIAEAGRKNAVTIATNMAGRGTDILLGGSVDDKILTAIQGVEEADKIKSIVDSIRADHEKEREEVLALGGLYVLGSERHESRRIDNQLRGRSGRLGDAGASQFYLSLQDDLLRIFGGEKISSMLSKLGLKDDEVINHSMLTRVIANSQKRLENMHYEIRKNILKYDDISNEQRAVIYEKRKYFMRSNFSNSLEKFIRETIEYIIGREDRNVDDFKERLNDSMADLLGGKKHDNIVKIIEETDFSYKNEAESAIKNITTEIEDIYYTKVKGMPEGLKNDVERYVVLSTLDEAWKDHLYNISNLREGIHLRSYAQKDPLTEYKIEAFHFFQNMLHSFTYMVVKKLMLFEAKPVNFK